MEGLGQYAISYFAGCRRTLVEDMQATGRIKFDAITSSFPLNIHSGVPWYI
jgi:hypothetical protein